MNEDLLEILGDRLTDRIQKANTYYLTKIGEMIKKIRDLKPTQAQQLIQILKYGGSYEDILMEISSLTGIDPIEIDRIFAQYSRNDLNFAKKFYDYRNIPFIPFDENIALKRQTEALANITKNAMNNFTRARALGYSFKELDGTTKFYGLRETYEKVLDEALLNVGQGRDTFDNSMTRILKELGGSGLRTLDYASGRSIRLDSMVRMHLKSGLRELHNENQRLFGEEYGADGVEVSVHINPAEDHSVVQGRQFSYDEFNKLQDTGIGTDYKGKEIDITTGVEKISHRPISEYNCYHYTFSIVLGVSEPRYSDEQLQKIIDDNNKGFEYEGKHYTNYEGTQLMRSIERRVREQKDINIVAKASDNKELDYDSRYKITILSNKYKEISNISGLPTKANRIKVSGYTGKPVKIEPKVETPTIQKQITPKTDLDTEYMSIKQQLSDNKIKVSDSFFEMTDKEMRNKNLKQLQNLTSKYNVNRYSNNNLNLDYNNKHKNWLGWASYGQNSINLTKEYFDNKEKLIATEKRCNQNGWHYRTTEDKLDIYTITHEYGHTIEYEYYRKAYDNAKRRGVRFDYTKADKELRDTLMSNAMSKANEKMSITEFKNKYFSRYGMSKRTDEWFAELFAQHELGEKTPFTEALGEWLEVFFK